MEKTSFTLRSSLTVGITATLAFFAMGAGALAAPVDLLSSGQAWYRSSSGFAGAPPANNGAVADGTLMWRQTNQNGEMISYFAPSGSPVALQVGQQMRLNFTYSIENPLSRVGTFRIGLLNSNDSARISTNNFTDANASDYTGYFITTGPSSSVADISRLYQRNNTGSNKLIAGTGTDFPSVGNAGGYVESGRGYGLQNNVTYNGFLQVAYVSADVVRITYSFNDDSTAITWLDTAAKYTSFDSIALSFGKNSSDADQILKLSGLTYEISQIPEPATLTMLAGALAIGAVLALRRRRSVH